MSEENNIIPQETVTYNDDNIRTLTGLEHIRLRPGMYIGRLGDGSSSEDGIYVLLKEVFDNSIDEFKMKAGDRIEVNVDDNLRISVRDYGRGIPQGKLIESVSILNTSGKFDSKAFKKSIGLNGVGVKAVNALARPSSSAASWSATSPNRRRTRVAPTSTSNPMRLCSRTTVSMMRSWRTCFATIPI